jgi:large subunit ribosomal protein L18
MNAKILKRKIQGRQKRKLRIRGKISGTAARPRVSVFKSNRFMYAQAIDDAKGYTLAACDGAALKIKPTKEGAKALAEKFAAVLKDKGIEKIVFDTNGYQYHGVVASFADELRNQSIVF